MQKVAWIKIQEGKLRTGPRRDKIYSTFRHTSKVVSFDVTVVPVPPAHFEVAHPVRFSNWMLKLPHQL